MGPVVRHAEESLKQDCYVHIYDGRDSQFELYDHAGVLSISFNINAWIFLIFHSEIIYLSAIKPCTKRMQKVSCIFSLSMGLAVFSKRNFNYWIYRRT